MTRHTARRLAAGAYEYRGRIIERMSSDGYPPSWFVRDAATHESVMDPTDTLADAKHYIDIEMGS